MNTHHHLHVRRATAADAASLAQLRWQFRSSLGAAVETELEFVARCVPWMRSHLADERQWRAFIWTVGGAVAGNVWLQLIEKLPNPVDEPEVHGYVTNFFVQPERRNAGAGSALLTAVLSECESAGVDTIFLWPTPRSRSLYERHGFSAEHAVLVRAGRP